MGDDCGHHENKKLKKRIKKIGIWLSIILVIILLIIFIVWLVLRPTKPRFILQDASLNTLNVSDSVTSTFQLTVQSHNPNDRIGIYYDRLLVYASYRSQQITLPTSIPFTFQDTNGVNIWTPLVTGERVPVAPFTGKSLRQDEAGGRLLLNVIMDGRLRWKVGSFVSRSYGIHVNCPATFSSGNPNGNATNSARFQLAQTCSVNV